MEIRAVDYHTGGEPFRIVTGGVEVPRGATILDKRRDALERLDHVRRLLVYEPRGHADMYGCFVVEPDDDGADLGVVFFHNAGYSTACGHGTIALATWALETGVVDPSRRELVVDVPSGRLPIVVSYDNGKVERVRFRNVPAYVHAEGLPVETSRGQVTADVAYGGAFYASVEAAALGLRVEPRHIPALIEAGREIKHALEAANEIVHPEEPELRDVYGVVFWQEEGRDPLRQRNVAIFADGEVDRSPCGSGTSARLALLDASGELPRGETLVHESVIGTVFEGRVVGEAEVSGRPAVVTEIAGRAHRTGSHEFVLDPDDELGTGFLLR